MVFLDGEGSNAAGRAKDLAQLKYDVALFTDSDRDPVPSVSQLEASGVEVFQWSGNVSVEQRIALDLPWEHLQCLVDIAKEDRGWQSVRDAVASRLKVCGSALSENLDSWREIADDQSIRAAIGEAAKDSAQGRGWFKNYQAGKKLGVLVGEVLAELA